MDDLVSVIVPVRNAENDLPGCLRSILAQTGVRFELIVINNDCTDGTAELIKKFSHQGVVSYDIAPASRGSARAHGIRQAMGRIVVMIDVDCVAEPDWLRELISPIVQEDASLVVGQTLCSSDSGWGRLVHQAEQLHLHENASGRALKNFTSTHFAVSRSCLEKVGFDSRLRAAEDFDFGLQCRLHSIPIVYTSAAKVRHRYPASLANILGRAFSRGFWTFSVIRKHELSSQEFQAEIRREKGFGSQKILYVIPWSLRRFFLIPLLRGEKRDQMIFSTFYELAWQLGGLVSRISLLFGGRTTPNFPDRTALL